MRSIRLPVLMVAALLILSGCGTTTSQATSHPTAQARPITEFPVPTPASDLHWITAGHDGNLWFRLCKRLVQL